MRRLAWLRWAGLLACILVGVAGCGTLTPDSPQGIPTPLPHLEVTATAEATATLAVMPQATRTQTPTPTATPVPAPTATAAPEARWLAFDSDRSGNSEIYLLDAATGSLINLTRNPAEDRAPAWAPVGSRLAFESNRDGNWDLYALDLTSGVVERLTQNPHFDGAPAWSADGSRLAFESYRDGNLEIYLLESATGAVRRLTDHPAGDYAPAWSPDGQWVAFTSWRDGQKEVYAIDLSGGELVNLTQNPADDESPAWSPDGSRLAFISWRDVDPKTGNRNAEIYQLDMREGLGQATAGTAERLTENIWPDLDPAFGSDGRLLWASYEPGAPFETYDAYRPGALHIWQWNPYTGERERLAPPGESRIADAPPDDRHPAAPHVAVRELALAAELLVPAVLPPQVEPTGTRPAAYAFVPVPGVVTTYDGQEILLSERVADSFSGWAEAIRLATGHDYMYLTLGSWRPIDAVRSRNIYEYDYAYLSWHKAGRAADLALEYRDADGEQKMVLTREDLGEDLYWRLYLKTSAQDGSQGEPLREWPWQFWWHIVEAEAPEAYAAGGRRLPIPEGYFADLTAAGKRLGWHRIASYRRGDGDYHWHKDSNGTEYWHYERTDGLIWLDAMREVYSEQDLERHFRWDVGLSKAQSPEMMRSKGIEPAASTPGP